MTELSHGIKIRMGIQEHINKLDKLLTKYDQENLKKILCSIDDVVIIFEDEFLSINRNL